MSDIDTKSLQIFEDMKTGFYNWSRDGEDQYIIRDDPQRYEVTMEFPQSGEILWARYVPHCQNLYVGLTFPFRIPKNKMPFMLAHLSYQNYISPLMRQSSQHLTICPVCRRVDSIIGIHLRGEKLTKAKFQMLLSISKIMSNQGQYQSIRAIAYKGNSIEDLITPLRAVFPDRARYFGGDL